MSLSKRIEHALSDAIAHGQAGAAPPRLASALGYAVTPGGARIRPTILLSVAKACGLAKEVLQKDGVEKIAVMMSIVSNTRVDIVARGVIKACLELGKDPGETIAVFRIPGAWEEEGAKILDHYGVEYYDRSVSLWDAAGRAVEKVQGGAS